MASPSFPIIDSHIHLYPETHLSQLNWTADLPPDHILNRQSSVEQYKLATEEPSTLLGFVFLETDRKFILDESGWQDPLDEVAFLARIAQGQPIDGEGHSSDDAKLVLGIVPWAPVPAGAAALEKYVSRVRESCGDSGTFNLVKGFRYLLQDKPTGTMLQPDFVQGLQWLGENNFIFDLGVDARQRGLDQLREACQMLELVFNEGNPLKVIINHCCKPNLRLSSIKVLKSSEFHGWKECIEKFASYPTTYMKFSGLFSELPPQDQESPTAISELLEQVKPWIDVVFAAFGPSRIMFGSDWPVCQAGGPGTKSWQHWVDLITAILDGKGLTDVDKQRVWSDTAAEAYSIDVPRS